MSSHSQLSRAARAPWKILDGLRPWSRSRAGLSVLLGVPVVGLYCVLAQWPLWAPGDYPLAAGNLLVTMTFYAAAVFVAEEPEHRLTGAMLGAAALLWPINWIDQWNVGPLPLVAALEGPLASLLAVWALLRYPALWSLPREERIVVAALVIDQVLAFLPVLTSLPEWHGQLATSPWLSWWPDRRAFAVTSTLSGAAQVVAAAAAAVAIVVRLARLPGPDRRVMRPVLVAIVVAGGLTVISNIAAVAHVPEPHMHALYAAEGIATVLIPAAFLVAAARRYLTRESLPALIHSLGAAPTPSDVQNALRSALADPGLQLLYDLDGALIDIDGQARASIAADDPRLVTTVATPSGANIVLLTDNPLLSRYRPLVDTAAAAAGLALDNTRLQAAISARIHAVERSARRLSTAANAERQHIRVIVDNILHTEFAALARQLESMAPAPEPDIDDHLNQARIALTQTRQELAVLADGMLPQALEGSGLSAAVTAAAHRLAPLARIDITCQALPDTIQAAAYFVLMELITNAVKHADGAQIEATATIEASRLRLHVRDDGPGGADLSGSGLRGVADRIRTLGGTLQINSDAGRGTDITAALPL